MRILLSLGPSRKALAALRAEDPDCCVDEKSFENVMSSMERIEKLMKFTASLLLTSQERIVLANDCGLTLSPSEDAVYLVGYAGKKSLEKGLAEITQSNTTWKVLIEDVVRTANTSLKLKPEMDRIIDTLDGIESSGTLPTSRLQELNEVMPKLQSGMRRCDVQPVEDKMVKVLIHQADVLMAGKHPEPSTGFVEALSCGLKTLSRIPGTTTKLDAVQAWMTQNSKDMSINDFAQLANEVRSTGVVSLEKVQAVMSKMAKVRFAEDRKDLFSAAKVMLNASFQALITEAGWLGLGLGLGLGIRTRMITDLRCFYLET